jgi:hypothetical protein
VLDINARTECPTYTIDHICQAPLAKCAAKCTWDQVNSANGLCLRLCIIYGNEFDEESTAQPSDISVISQKILWMIMSRTRHLRLSRIDAQVHNVGLTGEQFGKLQLNSYQAWRLFRLRFSKLCLSPSDCLATAGWIQICPSPTEISQGIKISARNLFRLPWGLI